MRHSDGAVLANSGNHQKCPTVGSASGASSGLTTIALGLATAASLHYCCCRLLQCGALASTQSGSIPKNNGCFRDLPSKAAHMAVERCVVVPGSWSHCIITVIGRRRLPRCFPRTQYTYEDLLAACGWQTDSPAEHDHRVKAENLLHESQRAPHHAGPSVQGGPGEHDAENVLFGNETEAAMGRERCHLSRFWKDQFHRWPFQVVTECSSIHNFGVPHRRLCQPLRTANLD